MGIERLETFLSCSFQENDAAVVALFSELCSALNLSCSNVDSGGLVRLSETIANALDGRLLLIAICTRREEKKNGKFDMSVSVRSEIAMACAMRIPVQLFVEDGVELDGFEKDLGIQVHFKRERLYEPSKLKEIVKTLHNVREQALERFRTYDRSQLDSTEAQFVRVRTYLPDKSAPCWVIKNHKKILFSETSQPYSNFGYWLENYQLTDETAPIFEFDVKMFDSSRTKIETTIKRQDSREIAGTIQFLPAPGNKDWIDYETTAYSPLHIPRWSNETSEKNAIQLSRGTYRAFDGFIVTINTRLLTVEHRLPRDFLIVRDELIPFAAMYTSDLDYEVKHETGRIVHTCDFIGDELVSLIKIENPMRGCMYGIAWNPKEKPVT